ncbi:MAG TPA: aminoglycoside phosphotransferase [Thiomicrospira sp.]|nr:aminoglycoside phosphotransferase [Thiomicrospira sp.]
MSDRFTLMQTWLSSLEILKKVDFSEPEPASSDASFRRYFRIKIAGSSSLIIMDAPPAQEDSSAFIIVSQQLKEMGLNVPVVLAHNLAQGFLLLSDLGVKTYLSVLNESNVDELYSNALSSLVTLQTKGVLFANKLPAYDTELLTAEMSLFDDWLGKKHLATSMNKIQGIAWHDLQNILVKSALAQPQVYVHRDYHSRNLMFVESENQPGILDYQDAVKGPLTYDAVSLLRDCYISWEEEQVSDWQREYFLMLTKERVLKKDEWSGFQKSMNLMGIQRHLKASGIFARLYHRDGKENYLADIPATLTNLTLVAEKYPETQFLVDWVEKTIRPKLDDLLL